MNKSVFVSHASCDKEIASLLVDLIEDGIGVPEEEIFCSSLDGYGIPVGENFVTFIKSQMIKPKVVILLLTPCYFSSNFCLSELGAAWIMSHRIFPILVPPLGYDSIKDVLTGTEVVTIKDDVKYNELKTYLVKEIGFDPKSPTKWDTKRRSFLKDVDSALKSLAVPNDVSQEEHIRICKELEEAKAELDAYEHEQKQLKEYIGKLEQTKDKTVLEEAKKEFLATGISKEFEGLVDEISSFRRVLASGEVFKFVLADYYKQPYRVNYYQNGEEFESAARYKFVYLGDDSESVNWENTKLDELKELLDQLTLLAEEDERAEELSDYHDCEYGFSLELDNQEFWEFHYKV